MIDSSQLTGFIPRVLEFFISGFLLSIRYSVVVVLMMVCLVPALFFLFFVAVLLMTTSYGGYIAYFVHKIFISIPHGNLVDFAKIIAQVMLGIGFMVSLVEQIFNTRFAMGEWRFKPWFWVVTIFNIVFFSVMLAVFIIVPSTESKAQYIYFIIAFFGFYLASLVCVKLILMIDQLSLGLSDKLFKVIGNK